MTEVPTAYAILKGLFFFTVLKQTLPSESVGEIHFRVAHTQKRNKTPDP